MLGIKGVFSWRIILVDFRLQTPVAFRVVQQMKERIAERGRSGIRPCDNSQDAVRDDDVTRW